MDTLKVLGQVAPPATTLVNLYVVPVATQVTVSSVVVCNRSSTSTIFRISVAITGAVDNPSQYLYFDVVLPGNDTFVATIGVTLSESDVVRVFAGNDSLTFQLFGVEVK